MANRRCEQITLSGFGFVILNILTLLWYSPGLDQDCPPWVYASWSIGLFLYQTFDAVDGSQAFVGLCQYCFEGSANLEQEENTPEWTLGRAVRSWYAGKARE